jgi:hypothetical protein
MHDLFSNLDQSTLTVLKVFGTATVLWAAWRIFVKDAGLKTFTVKFAWFVIDLLEPELPQRKLASEAPRNLSTNAGRNLYRSSCGFDSDFCRSAL